MNAQLLGTLDATALLDKRYREAIDDGTPRPIRLVILRALNRLEEDARRMLTGESK